METRPSQGRVGLKLPVDLLEGRHGGRRGGRAWGARRRAQQRLRRQVDPVEVSLLAQVDAHRDDGNAVLADKRTRAGRTYCR